MVWRRALLQKIHIHKIPIGRVPAFAPVTRLGYSWLAPVRELTKPWALARNLHRPEVLAKISAVDRFIDEMPGYPGRFFNQAIGRIVVHRDLANGTVHLTDDLKIDMDRRRPSECGFG